jgi:hypothetical protein
MEEGREERNCEFAIARRLKERTSDTSRKELK